MLPTLNPGEEVTLTTFDKNELRRGLIVLSLVTSSEGKEYKAIFRIVGLPGEQVEVKSQRLKVNGSEIIENYLKYKDVDKIFDFGPTTVPNDSVFLLGDHRDNSKDGRFLKEAFTKLSNVKMTVNK